MAATVTDVAALDGVDVVDCDVHVAPRTLEPLLAYMDDYWADYVAHSELFLSPSMNGTYPPAAFLPGAAAGTRVAVPATLNELRDGFLASSPASSAVLTCITPFDTSRNPYYEAALCAGVNDWMRSQFLERDDRLRGSLVLPTLDPDAAVAEIERLGAHPGFVQVLLPVRTEAPYGNPRHHRVWEAAERAGLVVGLHAWGRVGNAPTASGFIRSYLEDYAATRRWSSRPRSRASSPKACSSASAPCASCCSNAASRGCRSCCGASTRTGRPYGARSRGSGAGRPSTCASTSA